MLKHTEIEQKDSIRIKDDFGPFFFFGGQITLSVVQNGFFALMLSVNEKITKKDSIYLTLSHLNIKCPLPVPNFFYFISPHPVPVKGILFPWLRRHQFCLSSFSALTLSFCLFLCISFQDLRVQKHFKNVGDGGDRRCKKT